MPEDTEVEIPEVIPPWVDVNKDPEEKKDNKNYPAIFPPKKSEQFDIQ